MTADERTSRHGSAARALRDALEPVAAHAFWSARTRRAMTGLGLTGAASYVRGRAAVLGDVTPAVAIAAFGWFEPALIESSLQDGPTGLTPAEIDAARSAATGASLRTVRPAADPTWLADVLTTAVAAGSSLGRPLFAARRVRTPSDPFERLWWAGETLRDHRGDSHIAAATVAGVGAVEMNILTELSLGGPLGEYTATRGWSTAKISEAANVLARRGWLDGAALTDGGRQARLSIERHTDELDAAVVASIGAELPTVLAELDVWARACIDAGAFPADEFKRRAG